MSAACEQLYSHHSTPAGRAQEAFLRRDGKVAPRRGYPVVQFVGGVGEKPWGTGGFTVIQQRVV